MHVSLRHTCLGEGGGEGGGLGLQHKGIGMHKLSMRCDDSTPSASLLSLPSLICQLFIKATQLRACWAGFAKRGRAAPRCTAKRPALTWV